MLFGSYSAVIGSYWQLLAVIWQLFGSYWQFLAVLGNSGSYGSYIGIDTYMIYDPKFTVHNIQHTDISVGWLGIAAKRVRHSSICYKYVIVNLIEDGWCGIASKRVWHLSIWY